MAKIKICGLTRPEDIAAANRALPDYIGFVFAAGKRQVSQEQARRLKALLSPAIRAVGVFVNEEPEQIVSIVRDGTLDLVQLHGDEDEAYIRALKKRLPDTPLIKAVRVRSREQIERAEALPCEYLLLDTYIKGQYGGSGRSFDRSLIPSLGKPYFLAGGLNGENIPEALAQCCPYCVDVSSGAETEGKKDPVKMENLVRLVKMLKGDSPSC